MLPPSPKDQESPGKRWKEECKSWRIRRNSMNMSSGCDGVNADERPITMVFHIVLNQ